MASFTCCGTEFRDNVEGFWTHYLCWHSGAIGSKRLMIGDILVICPWCNASVMSNAEAFRLRGNPWYRSEIDAQYLAHMQSCVLYLAWSISQ